VTGGAGHVQVAEYEPGLPLHVRFPVQGDPFVQHFWHLPPHEGLGVGGRVGAGVGAGGRVGFGVTDAGGAVLRVLMASLQV
jgi:hypothetical protein